MAARGSIAKEKILEKLKEVYPDSFMDAKVLRIPMEEEGETIEIKVTLTAAKDILGAGSAPSVSEKAEIPSGDITTVSAPTEEEIANVKKLLSSLSF